MKLESSLTIQVLQLLGGFPHFFKNKQALAFYSWTLQPGFMQVGISPCSLLVNRLIFRFAYAHILITSYPLAPWLSIRIVDFLAVLLVVVQYDWDAATTMGFLKQYSLQDEFKLNIECNHATLAHHSCEHELQLASAYGMLGNIDANTGDPQTVRRR